MSLTINGTTNVISAPSGLTVSGNTAVTGTLSASVISANTNDLADGIVVSGNDNTNVKMRLVNAGAGGESWQVQVGVNGASNSGLHVRNNTTAATIASFYSTSLTLGTGVNLVAPTSYVEGSEMTAPAAPAANGFRIFAEDNGSGKTRLMVQFATGAAQQIAIEP